MADTLNTFDGGSNSTTITTGNSGGTSGDAWSAVVIGSGGGAIYTNSAPYRGGISGQITTGTAGAISYVEKTLSGASTGSLYARIRFKMPTLPDATGVRPIVLTDSAGNFQVDVRLISTGAVRIATGAGTTIGTSTKLFQAGEWVDIAVAILVFSATVGQAELKVYDAAGNTNQTITSGATIDTLRSGGTNKVQAGAIRSGVNSFVVHIDDVATSTAGYPATTRVAGVAELSTTTYASANTTTLTTASFTPASSSLLVAYVSAANGSALAASAGAVTDSLGGTWTRLAGETGATGGSAEIWARDIGTGASMTVTWNPGGSVTSGLDIIVKAYGGAKPVASQPGATALNGGGTSYQKAITTVVVGSLVAGALGRQTDPQTLTANASTTILGQINGSQGDLAALFRAKLLTYTTGSVTIGGSNSAAGANYIALAEIMPAVVNVSLSSGVADTVTAGEAVGQALAGPRATADTVASADAVSRTSTRPRATADTVTAADSVGSALLAHMSGLVDNFDDNSIDASKWPGNYGTVSEVGGRARLTCDTSYNAYVSAAVYTFDSVFLRVYPAAVNGATGSAYLSLFLASTGQPAGTNVGFSYDAVSGLLSLINWVGFSDGGLVTLTYDPVAHAWWRLGVSAGTLVWQTSPDGSTWTTQRSISTPAWLAAASDVKIFAEAHRDSGSTNFAELENFNAAPAAPISKSTSDTVTAGDTVTASVLLARTVTDTVTGADAAGQTAARARPTSDTVAGADTVTRARLLPAATADTVAAADTVTRAEAWPRATADTVTGGDTAAQTAARARPAADTATCTDSAGQTAVRARPAVDTVAGADTVTRARLLPAAVGDTVAAADTVARSQIAPRTVADGAGATDSIARQLAAAGAAAATVACADTAGQTTVRARPVSDTVATADSTARTGAWLRATADTVAPADAADASRSAGALTADMVSAAEQVTRSVSAAGAVTDPLGLNDLPSRAGTYARAYGDAAAAADDVSGLRGAAAEATDVVSAADAAATALATSAAIDDAVSLDDLIVVGYETVRDLVDELALGEVLAESYSLIRFAPAQRARFSEAATAAQQRFVQAGEGLAFGDTAVWLIFVPNLVVAGGHSVRETGPVSTVAARWPTDLVSVTSIPGRVTDTGLASTVRRSG